MVRSLAIVVALLGSAAGAAEPLPFEGRWALRAESCGSEAEVTTLTAERLHTRVMSCRFGSVLPGATAFRVEADCDALGQTGHEFFTFAVLDGKLYWTWAERTGTFERCDR